LLFRKIVVIGLIAFFCIGNIVWSSVNTYLTIQLSKKPDYQIGTISIDGLNLTLGITEKDNVTVIKPLTSLFGEGRLL
jgi:hypothetical protein